MKTCSKCKVEKDAREFYRDKRNRDGLQSQCKACIKSRSYEPRTEGTKTCSKCGECKDVGEFDRHKRKRDGLSTECKACRSAYHAANKDKISKRKSAYYAANKDKISAYRAENKGNIAKRNALYYVANKDTILKQAGEYYVANKGKILKRVSAYQKHRYATDPRYALCQRARSAANKAINGLNATGFFRHMPYTRDEFVAHLISTLPPDTDPAEICDGDKWHIDHIRPMASFEFEGGKDGEDWQRCWALANLRMLPAAENMAKGDSLSERPTPGECPVQDWIWETERTNKTDDDTHVGEILSNLFDTLDTGRESADTTRGNSAV